MPSLLPLWPRAMLRRLNESWMSLLGAMAQACPDRIPAASQGTMNNLTIGGWDEHRHDGQFTYYETIGGGTWVRVLQVEGASGRHSHMTNTLNTPVEALEYIVPVSNLSRYALREGVRRKRPSIKEEMGLVRIV